MMQLTNSAVNEAAADGHAWSSAAIGERRPEHKPELALWGPGFRPNPFPAQSGSAMLRVTSELGKEAGNVYIGIDVHRKRRTASRPEDRFR